MAIIHAVQELNSVKNGLEATKQRGNNSILRDDLLNHIPKCECMNFNWHSSIAKYIISGENTNDYRIKNT